MAGDGLMPLTAHFSSLSLARAPRFRGPDVFSVWWCMRPREWMLVGRNHSEISRSLLVLLSTADPPDDSY